MPHPSPTSRPHTPGGTGVSGDGANAHPDDAFAPDHPLHPDAPARIAAARGHADDLMATLTLAAREGHDLPDLLAAALQAAAAELGSVEALTATRPGSWEAGHVEALAGPAAFDGYPLP